MTKQTTELTQIERNSFFPNGVVLHGRVHQDRKPEVTRHNWRKALLTIGSIWTPTAWRLFHEKTR